MRFNSPELLERWKAGQWPAIHDDLFNLIISEADSRSFCDLGCCFGLLGERVKRYIRGSVVCGIEADQKAIASAFWAGITIPILQLRVTRDTIERVVGWMKQHGATALIARRILPELWADDPEGGAIFVDEIHRAGIHEIFVQGRNLSTRSTNRLCSIENEIAMLFNRYSLKQLHGQCGYLKAI